LKFKSINANQTENIIVASTAVLLEIDNGVSNMCANFAGSVSSRDGNVFRLGHWINDMCSTIFKEGFLCTNCGEAVAPRRLDSAITFISWSNIIFSHITFDTMPKLNFTCGFMADRKDVKVLVHNRLQEELIRLGCESYNFVIPKSRFVRHPTGRPVTARKLYFPFFFVNEAPGTFYQKHIGVSGEPGLMRPLHHSVVSPHWYPIMTKTASAAEQWVAEIQKDTILYIRRPRWRRSKTGEVTGKRNSRWLANEEDIMRTVCAAAGLATSQLKVRAWTPSNDYRRDRYAMSKVRAVISPHGGQMGNILFAPAGTLVVELVDVVSGNLCFLGLSRMLGFDYEAVTPTSYGHNQHKVHAKSEWIIAALAKHIPQLRDGLVANGIVRGSDGSVDVAALQGIPAVSSENRYCHIDETIGTADPHSGVNASYAGHHEGR
jgi:hypothetical protein